MSNRIAFITGASRGIGRACAETLAQAGARVVLAARSLEKLEEVAEGIRSGGGQAFTVAIDLASEESIKEAFARTAKEVGSVEIPYGPKTRSASPQGHPVDAGLCETSEFEPANAPAETPR
ncbi:MAG: SDR family NAD(P)-dependent oxidoreductase, partial [Planctomycetota bacterium]